VTKVRRFYALDDCGTRINPMIIEGQVHGGLTEAFGIAMGQEIRYDEVGNVTGPTLMDYFLPTAVETPKWETDWTTTPSPHHPIGAKGVGERSERRRRALLLQCGERRLQVPRLDPHRHAARSLAHLDGRRQARPPWMIPDRDRIAERLAAVGHVADRDLATALWLMDYLKRPLLLEGEAGVGKTEVAKALAAVHETELIRLQCYEGLDQNAALYEWNYQRQLLAIKAHEGAGESADPSEEHIFSRSTCWSVRCWRRSDATRRWCCWSTRSIAPTRSSRRSCWNCCRTSRSAFPSWAR
jgi:hypothetical protein